MESTFHSVYISTGHVVAIQCYTYESTFHSVYISTLGGGNLSC